MTRTIYLIILSFVGFIHSFEFKDKVNEFSTNLNNPYRVLKISPWSSYTDIEKQYKNLEKDAPFEDKVLYEEALDIIHEQRINQNISDDDKMPILRIIKEIFTRVFTIEFVLGIITFALWLFYKFQGWLSSPLFFLILSFELTGKLIPHYFKNALYQYIFALIAGFILFGMKELLLKWIKNKKTKATNTGIKDN